MAAPEFFSRDGELQVDGRRFMLKGCSWFGYETETRCVHGIWSHALERFLDFLAEHGFNAIRVPFAAEVALDLDGIAPTSVDCGQNPGLAGKSAGGVLDCLVAEAAKRGILVMLDMHRLTAEGGITPLWYTDAFPEAQVTEAWTTIVRRYAGAWNVFAADIKNEPHDAATWGDGCAATDWRAAAQRIGDAILAVNPRLLIFVEGTSQSGTPATTPEAAFWGGQLAAARAAPVQLSAPDKLVYSPHVYGPGVYMQPYFQVPGFPGNLPSIWTRQWAHLLAPPKAGPACVVGEWGGFFREGDIERQWAEAFVAFLLQTGATDSFFWCLNPNSGDTGGLLEDDWQTPCHYKLGLLQRLCPAPGRIQVDASGQPVGVHHGSPADSAGASAAVAVAPAAAGKDAGGGGGGGGGPQLAVDRQGQHQAVEVDAAAVPHVQLTASIVNSWCDGQRGWEYQVEARVRNVGAANVRDICIEILPVGCLRRRWNLRELEPGRSYGLLGFWPEKGGLVPGEEMGWGGIVSAPAIKLVVTPL